MSEPLNDAHDAEIAARVAENPALLAETGSVMDLNAQVQTAPIEEALADGDPTQSLFYDYSSSSPIRSVARWFKECASMNGITHSDAIGECGALVLLFARAVYHGSAEHMPAELRDTYQAFFDQAHQLAVRQSEALVARRSGSGRTPAQELLRAMRSARFD